MRMQKKITGFMLAGALLVSSLLVYHPIEAFDHGTTDQEITESMLLDTPPADYQIDESLQGDAKDGVYNSFFLKEDIQTVSIDVDENNLNYLFQKADQKPTVMTNSVTIGDKKIGYAGLKTKGSYTLQHVVSDNPGSDRFSFTVNFGKYIKKKNGFSKRQNFYGCNKISFNNFFFDKSMMREYIAMKLLTEMGLPTPQYGLTRLYINGSYYGVYFMVESLDSSILEQYLGVDDQEVSSYIAKPEETTLEYDTSMNDFLRKDGTFDLSSVLKMDVQGNYKVTGNLEDQAYLWEEDDETLQDVADMLPTVLGWQRKLTLLSQGKDFDGKTLDVNSEEYLKLLEQVMDVDEAVRYFAAHSWLVQLDNMFVEQHNLGLYVGKDGRSMMMPWDYDLSFGCYYPSTAETTANMNVDLMYKNDQVAFGYLDDFLEGDQDVGANADALDYSRFPFFQVIYQNQSLMEKYHQYMKDCSKIAALGGITSDGKIYEAGWFYSCISAIETKLIEAASEKTAKNVYYLNYTSQPEDIKLALPNLKKIIALRALGVLLQVDGEDAIVSGAGCDLETLGNAMPGRNSSGGRLAVVDESTGIYSIAEYEDSWSSPSPSLRIQEIEQGESVYQRILNLSQMTEEDMRVYTIVNTASAEGDYTLYIPMDIEDTTTIPEIYSVTDQEEIQKLEVKKADDRYYVTAKSTDYIAYVSKHDIEVLDFDPTSLLKWLQITGGVFILAAVIVGIALLWRKKKGKASGH